MDESTRNRCVELFFTTKGARGTGLGLAMVNGMAERHGGDLSIESQPGTGTRITLGFPVTAAGDPALQPAVSQPSRQAKLHLLLIDDDPIILKSLRDTLERDGHTVETADGGQRGIDQFVAAGSRGAPFALVITDLGMPHVDGRAVAGMIKTLSPVTPVVLLTGWGQRLLATNDTPPNVDRLISKPPTLAILRKALADLAPGVPA